MAVKGTMDAEARRATLLDLATERGGLQLSEAAALCGVHPMTIRRDFELLETTGRARRVRGAIVPLQADPFALRKTQNLRAKQRIAEKLLPLVPPGAAVGLDASTTVHALVEALPPDAALTVVTTGLSAFEVLSHRDSIRCYLTGGEREEANLSLVGALARNALGAFHLDIAVMSAMGVHADSGTSESTLAQASVKDAMAHASERVVLAVDSTKLQSRARVRSLPLDRVSTLVTELDPGDARLDPYRSLVAEIL